jgi:RNA polymerase sigma-70 factor, ECF subfamily
MVGFAASKVGRETAEDLAQEALLVLHQKYRHLDRLEDLLPLSLQIVRFKMAAAVRKAVRRGEHTQVSVDDVPPPDDRYNPLTYVERIEMLDRLAAMLAGMEARCQELFRMKLQGRSFAEIRERMGAKSINTIYTWDFRCRKQLLERMGGSWEPRP